MPKHSLLRILLFILVAGYGFSCPLGILKGRVSDSEGKPLADVKVEVRDSKLSTQTEADGAFVFEGLDQEKALLVFSHPDYITHSLEVSLEQSIGQVIEVTLIPKNPILMTIREEISVTAEADSIIDVNLPSHRTILPSSVLAELGTANITESVDKIPGVAAVGKGGYSMVPAIRGLAEHRILLLVDGVRITSERRIGASASFVDLGSIDRVEINRGPYSVFHGSGAVGGIINIITKTPKPDSPFKGNFSLSYNSARNERAGSAAVSGSRGKWGWMLGANRKKADDYSAPSGPIEWSRYGDYNLMFKLNRQGEESQLYATVFHYRGTEIGKPSPKSRLKPRWYPSETNTLFTVGYKRTNIGIWDHLDASIFVLRTVLETQGDNLREDTLAVAKRSLAEIEGTNFGFKVRGGKALGSLNSLSFGIDYFGQDDVNDRNTEWIYDGSGAITRQTDETSLQDARRSNLGVYIDDKIRVSPSLTFNVGGRFDLITTSNRDFTGNRLSQRDEFISLYLGSIFQVTPQISLLANLGRSFRFPTISELFYTGLTGRGTVFGNPDLTPETSLNFDIGLRYLHERFFLSLYGFSNTVSDMIQKYAGTGNEEFFYRNLTRGRINGLEGEFYIPLAEDVELFVNFHHMAGKERGSDAALNYIPPSRLTLWGKYSPGRFWVEPRLTLSAAQDNPGPLEIAIDGYALFETIFGFKVNEDLSLLAITQNIFDQTYRPSADESGVDAPGRGIILKAMYSF
jgi:outer membrane receptor protein involved in Fe transport